MTRMAALLALVAMAAACSRLASCGRKHTPRKETITRLPTTMMAGSAVVSDDVTQYAYLVEDTKGVRMIRNGKAGENLRSGTNRSFIPHTHRHIYWGRGFDDRSVLGERFSGVSVDEAQFAVRQQPGHPHHGRPFHWAPRTAKH